MKLIKNGIALIAVISFALLNIQCKGNKQEDKGAMSEQKQPVTISSEAFGTTDDSIPVQKYTLKNSNGMEVSFMTYGGIITSLKVPNKNDVSEDVVLGFDSLAQYEKESPYFGALIGRYGNRIANGKFTLNGKEYSLAQNDGPNHLHGGLKGFDKRVWSVVGTDVDSTSASVMLTYLSKDMEEGYPGNLKAKVTYTLTNDNALEVHYEAKTDKPTVINLTQHSYFNLAADFSKPILDEEIKINADKFVPVDATLIPTGELSPVEGTPFDFRKAKVIGQDIATDNEQLKRGLGYDHCWVLNDQGEGIRFAASAYDPSSGRLLEVYTDEPGIQFYTGNFLDGTLPSKQGGTYGHRTGFCLETEHYPDSPNQKDFPSVVLNPEDVYNTKTIFKFSTK